MIILKEEVKAKIKTVEENKTEIRFENVPAVWKLSRIPDPLF